MEPTADIETPGVNKNPPVDLTTLSAPQLSSLKKQLDDELEHLTGSFAKLRAAQAKFRECLKSIREGVHAEVEGGCS